MAVAERQRSARSRQRIRHVFQSEGVRAFAGRRLDWKSFIRDGILRPVTAHRRNRSRRAVAVGGAATAPCRGRAQRISGRHSNRRSHTLTVFRSRIANPIYVDRTRGLILTNLPEPTTNVGAELLGTLRHEPYTLTATYTYVRARERVDGVRQDVALTPRRGAGIVGMWERKDKGRVGVEFYYTGAQQLEENPIR